MLSHIKNSWIDFPQELSYHISMLKPNATIVEIGGGANPSLSNEDVVAFKYVVIDISVSEINKAKGEHFERICTDITLDTKGIKCDLLFSKMVLEHIADPLKFHEACYNMLNAGGISLHFFATKYNPAALFNMFLPEYLSKQILYRIQKRNWDTEGKFPAYYRWATGPTLRQIKRFELLGFEIVKYKGYLGASYLSDISYFRHIEKFWNLIIIKLNSPWLCSNAIVVMSKKII